MSDPCLAKIIHTTTFLLILIEFNTLSYSSNYEIHTPSKHITKEPETNHTITIRRYLGTEKCKVPILIACCKQQRL